MKDVFLFKIKNKELDFGSDYNRARWNDFLSHNEDKWVRIQKPTDNRTNQQNNYYWLYLGIIAAETGNIEEELHEFFKKQFLPRKFAVIKGKGSDHEVEMIKSTTKLSKIEFGDYLDKICAMTDVPLPDPELAGYIK